MALSDWTSVPLAQILTERCETPPGDLLASGTIPIVSKIRFSDGHIELRNETSTKTKMILIRPGDLVLSGINAMKGAIAIYDSVASMPAAATIHYSSYQVDVQRADPRYLWWLLRSAYFRDVLQQQVPQGIKTELKAVRLLPVVIPLPPLQEQRRIVGRIESLAGRIAEAQSLQHTAVQEAKALLRAMITRALSPHQKRTNLGACLAEPLRNGLSISAGDMGHGEGIPFLKLGAVSFERFDAGQIKLVTMELPAGSPFWVQPDDLLMGRGNSLELVGRSALYKGESHRFAYPDLIIRIRLDKAKVVPEFAAWCLRSQEARDFIEARVVGTSPTMKKVSQPLIEQIPLPDVSLEEQWRIVQLLDDAERQIEQLTELQRSALHQLATLLPAVLDKAFRGGL